MNLFGIMGISASGLSAERTRAEVVAGNMANAESTHTAEGGPYQRKEVVFQSAAPSGFRMQLANAGAASDSRCRWSHGALDCLRHRGAHHAL